MHLCGGGDRVRGRRSRRSRCIGGFDLQPAGRKCGTANIKGIRCQRCAYTGHGTRPEGRPGYILPRRSTGRVNGELYRRIRYPQTDRRGISPKQGRDTALAAHNFFPRLPHGFRWINDGRGL